MSTITVPQAFAHALECHQAGRLADAEALYRQVLAVQPGHAGALHRLGVLALQHGRPDLAVELIRHSVAAEPGNFAAHSDLGEAWRVAGRLDEAVACYRRALEIHPGFASAHYNLGNVLLQQGRGDEAIAAYQRALQFQPDLPEACNNLGTALCQRQRLEEAMAAWRRAVQLRPGYLEAQTNLGGAFVQQGRFEEALATYRHVLQLQPDYAEVHLNLGNLFWAQGRRDEAAAAWRCTIEIKPDFAEAHYNLGNMFKEQGRFEEAIAAYHRAIQGKPCFAEAWNNLGDALLELGRFDEAGAASRQALEFRPGYACARYNLSVMSLLRGEYQTAWPGFDARWEAFHYVERRFPQPRWDGTPLTGQRVLLHAEQGFGDSIHFMRYAPLLAARGGEVIVECQRSLVELFRRAPGVSEVVAAGEALPPFDLHVPMLSLPLVFQTARETIPQEIPYLSADAARREIWRERLGNDHSRLRVGVAWAGNPQNLQLRKRDLPLEKLAPLLAVEGVDFHRLQISAEAPPLESAPSLRFMRDDTAQIHDFADTAALIMELDLIISVDTAVAHLAGALGRPVWTLLSFLADWRWGLGCDRAPWYPAMRLFRQPAVGDWDPVIRQVIEQLERLSKEISG